MIVVNIPLGNGLLQMHAITQCLKRIWYAFKITKLKTRWLRSAESKNNNGTTNNIRDVSNVLWHRMNLVNVLCDHSQRQIRLLISASAKNSPQNVLRCSRTGKRRSLYLSITCFMCREALCDLNCLLTKNSIFKSPICFCNREFCSYGAMKLLRRKIHQVLQTLHHSASNRL